LPKATNFFIKFCAEKVSEYEDHARNKSKYASINTHIIGGARGPMGLKGSTGVCRLLHALRTSSSDDLLNRSPWSFWRFHYQIDLLRRWLVDSRSISGRGGSSKSLWVFLVTEKEAKGRAIYPSRQKKESI
jgi:hypothetical protein